MKLKSKPKIPKENWVILIIFALGAFFIAYLILPKPARHTEMITSAAVKINPTDEEMEQIKQDNKMIAIKIQENGEYYLYIYGVYMNGEKIVGKYTLTKKQYDSINKSTIYWFEIKFKKINDYTAGTIKRVYDQKPF